MNIEYEAELLLVNTTESKQGGKHFTISTKPNPNSKYVRYEANAIDNELDTEEIAEARMEDELTKLKTANPDELETSLLETQEVINRNMVEDFRMRKLEAELSDLHRKKQSKFGLHSSYKR